MTRIGLVGCGRWGRNYISACALAGNALVTHVTRVSERVPLGPGLGGLKVLRDVESMAVAPVDAFVVAVPPNAHEEVCARLLETGRPVMLEKPMALSTEAAVRISEAVRPGSVFLVNHIHLFSYAYLRLRDIFEPYARMTFRVYSRGGGPLVRDACSALWDHGPHDFSMLLGLGLQASERVDIMWSPNGNDGRAGSYDVRLTYGSGTASVRVWDGGKKERSFEIFAPGLHVLYDDLDPDGRRLHHNGVPMDVSGELPLTAAIRAFAHSVQTGTVDWRFGTGLAVDVVRLIEASSLRWPGNVGL